MKRIVWITASALMLGCSFGSMLGACGGDDSATGGGSDGGGGSTDGTVGDDGGGGDDGSTGSDSGSGTDSGGGGLVSNPGEVSCGASSCDVGDAGISAGSHPYCCEEHDGGDSCQTSGPACGIASFRLECDESADCPSNRHDCCLQTNTIGPGPDAGITTGQAQCNNNCGGNDLQLCKTSAECGDGGACAMVTCRGGGTFYACNKNDDCK